ncbi:MAG: hypothetical protein IMF01_05210 [Proteobacteria bacterium]|nr:hypothetical protein [Pseudomonadota bacterium]
MDLRLTHRFLDQLWCQAVVAFLFNDASLLTGYLSRLDEKLTGTLTQLVDTNFLTGKRDELILIASQERIKAEKLLFVGLGSPKNYSFDVLSSAIKKISSTLERLALYEFGIMVPWIKGIKADYIELTKLTIRNLVDCYGIHKRDAVNVSLKVIFTIDKKIFPDLQSLEQEVRTFLDLPASDYSIAIDNSIEAK